MLRSSSTNTWIVYILECIDHTFYTGVTKDVTKRFAVHQAGKGAKYTRSHIPTKVVYTEYQLTLSEALKREAAIKQLSHDQKTELVKEFKELSCTQ